MVSQVSQQQMAGHAQSQVNIARKQWFFIWSDSPKGYFRWYLVRVGICSGPPCVLDTHGFVPG